jgi:hypothetical protein
MDRGYGYVVSLHKRGGEIAYLTPDEASALSAELGRVAKWAQELQAGAAVSVGADGDFYGNGFNGALGELSGMNGVTK